MLDLIRTVGLLVSLEMAEVAGELHLDERRAAALPRPGDRLAGGLVDGEEVEAVDDHAGHAESGRAVGNVVAGHRPGAGRALGVPVVLGDEDRWQVPHAGQVHRLERGALVAAAVAEERNADPAGALDLGGKRGPADQRRAAADDAVGAEHALGQVGDVHRAALAVAASGPAAVDLGHHLADIDALGDAVPMTAEASSPAYRCTNPGISPVANSRCTRSSNSRIARMVRYASSNCSRVRDFRSSVSVIVSSS